MTQPSETQERLKQRIRKTLQTMRRVEHDDVHAHAYVRDVTKLLSLIDTRAPVDSQGAEGDFPVSSSPNDYGCKEDNSMSTNYDSFRAGMLRAAEMARNEFRRAPEAAKGHDCLYMGGYEDACDHLSVAIAQAAVIDSVRIAGAQPDWQYHISLLLPDEGVEDAALLKIFQVVEHELRAAATQMRTACVEKVKVWAALHKHAFVGHVIDELYKELESDDVQQAS